MMRMRYGKLISKRREDTLRRYTSSRLQLIEVSSRMSNNHYHAAREWVYDYERFMCRGFEKQAQDALHHDPAISQAPLGVDGTHNPVDATP